MSRKFFIINLQKQTHLKASIFFFQDSVGLEYTSSGMQIENNTNISNIGHIIPVPENYYHSDAFYNTNPTQEVFQASNDHMSYYQSNMEIQGQDTTQNHFAHDDGNMINVQTKGNKQNIEAGGVVTSQVGSVFVTVANSVMASETINPVEAGASLTTTTYSSSASVSIPHVIQSPVQETTTVVIPPNLPEGCSLLIGEDNSQYVTVPQDGQTYAIPIAEFQAMQQGRTLTFQGTDSQTIIMQAPSSATAMPSNNMNIGTPNAQPTIGVSSEQMNSQPMVAATVNESQTLKTISPSSTPSNSTAKWGLAAGSQEHSRSTFTKASSSMASASMERKFKPIKVDNWGIFLLSRLQSYFQKKEFCDLTIRFPTRNAQIKVHRLMVNACTDFFLQLEQEAKEKGDVTEPNIIDMPPEFTPETVAPIVKFMYTGRLEFKPGSFEKLRETASKLQMFVLTKLMDAQLNSPITNNDESSMMKNGSKRKRKRNVGSSDEDPVKQMKKIRKIEKKFTDQEKKNRINKINSMSNPIKTEPGTLPGKKLPIWKKREFHVSSEGPTSQSTNQTTSRDDSIQIKKNETIVDSSRTDQNNVDDVKSQQSDLKSPTNANDISKVERMTNKDCEVLQNRNAETSKVVPNKVISMANKDNTNDDRIPVTHSMSSPAKAYGKDQPKNVGVPKRLREINEDLTFEKIRRTGTRKVPNPVEANQSEDGAKADSNKEGMEEDMKEFIEEQKKRLNQTKDGETNVYEDDDDYYDNDAELGYDDYNDSEDQPNIEHEQSSTQEIDAITLSISPARPILKSPAENTSQATVQSVPRKSVRFSLRPGGIPVPKGIDSDNAAKSSSPKTSTPKMNRNIQTRGEKVKPRAGNVSLSENNKSQDKDELDETVDEFTRAVEEEQQLEEENERTKKNVDKEETQNVKNQQNKSDISMTKSNASKTEMVSEILRKFPNILKDKKQVKIKVMAKDENGKPKMQIITLKSQGAVNNATANLVNKAINKTDTNEVQKKIPETSGRSQSPASNIKPNGPVSSNSGSKTETVEAPVLGNLLTGALGLRAIPKVKYTGKRGRPKKVQPGEVDPHADVRKEIEQRLQKTAGIGQTLVIESSNPGFDRLENQQRLVITKDGSQVGALDDVPQRLTDPSSEAEALSNVASGIATSLGLAANASNEQSSNDQDNKRSSYKEEHKVGPLADLENYDSQPISESSSVNHISTDSSTVKGNPSGSNSTSDESTHATKITKESKQDVQGGSKVKEMEMDWEDDEEI